MTLNTRPPKPSITAKGTMAVAASLSGRMVQQSLHLLLESCESCDIPADNGSDGSPVLSARYSILGNINMIKHPLPEPVMSVTQPNPDAKAVARSMMPLTPVITSIWPRTVTAESVFLLCLHQRSDMISLKGMAISGYFSVFIAARHTRATVINGLLGHELYRKSEFTEGPRVKYGSNPNPTYMGRATPMMATWMMVSMCFCDAVGRP